MLNYNDFISDNTLYIFDFDNTLVDTPNFNELAIEYLNEDISTLIHNSLDLVGKDLSDLNIQDGRIFINDPDGKINPIKNWVRKKDRLYLTEPRGYLLDNKCENKAIVTARPIESKSMIIETMKKLGLEIPNHGLFMYPGGKPQRKWKAEKISNLLDSLNFKKVIFYDDKPKVVKDVRKYVNTHNKDVDFKSIKYKSNNKLKSVNEMKMSKIVKRSELDGYKILIGKNAKMNDILSTSIADDDDIWLHASGVPGSHVVIQNPNNEDVPKNVIQFAAELAAKNSKSSGKTKVVVTKAKNVTKHGDMPDGKVAVNYKDSYFVNVTV